MRGMYNVKLVKTIFHRCKIYLPFLNESSEKTREMACFLYVRLPPVLNCEKNRFARNFHNTFTSTDHFKFWNSFCWYSCVLHSPPISPSRFHLKRPDVLISGI